MNQKIIVGLLALMCLCGCNDKKETEPVFISDIKTESVPWTHLNFRDDPAAFQFAIVTDRTGTNRPGIFPKAMERLNWLQPEFVINIGDLIEGYTEDRDVLFLCLNTEDTAPTTISDDQVAFVRRTLDDNPEVRWTLVFLHQPRWTFLDYRTGELTHPGWARVEAMIADGACPVPADVEGPQYSPGGGTDWA